MKMMRFDNEFHPGITMHKIPVKAGFPGLVFSVGMLTVCLIGIPGLIYFFALACVLGVGVAFMLRFMPRQAGFVVLVLAAVLLVRLVAE